MPRRRQDTVLTIPATPGAYGGRMDTSMTGRRVVIVTFASAQVLDVTGPLEVFSSASRQLPDVRYRTDVVSVLGGPVLTSCGLQLATTSLDAVDGPVDTLLVAGGQDMDVPCADADLLHHVRRLAAGARRVTSVCSGAFVLAAAGLLDGHRATTHWAECSLLAAGYPRVVVDPDAIYVRDGRLWTSAGVTSGIDLALALVADDHGRPAAAAVARQLVVYLRRSGGQAQFSAVLAAQSTDSEPLRDLLAWVPDHLADDLSVPALARRVSLSERQFRRVFTSEVGRTPAEHVEAVRLEAACRLLETTDRSVGQVAKVCGFGTPESMNRTFRRRLGTTPGDHRRHFGAAG
jgi:transcriptional regulator GlxA family with amidase domain